MRRAYSNTLCLKPFIPNLAAFSLTRTHVKKDDFEQGAAQCLVEMHTCQWVNRQMERDVDIYGIVTNGEGWKFYQLASRGEVSESLLYGIGEMSILLGLLRMFFGLCDRNLHSSV
ncbi:hypothetical protein H6F88_24085 [Oculatella sp. FACHB-28]|uniref:hypothetical protein n=1 Tax=Oculatella sp. FACHB-28 TaxID=2692845 RepID=UPI0016827ECA|nr:hypothetical protein [Oculatella sp. FACHB-28]MBD2059039.1 hypothetical protein [Oculatella sp. FACHB-28]